MPTGTGLSKFQAEFPDRFVRRRDRRAARRDAGDAASRWAACARSSRSTRRSSSGPSTRPSTTSARTTSRCCIAVDRAGLVGEDGTSHQGMFTLPAQRQLPNLVIASPEGRAGAALAAPDARSPRTTRSRSTTRATPGFGLAAGRRRRSSRSGGARSCARVATCCSSASGRSSCAAVEARRRAARPRAGRSASSTPGSRKPLDRQLILDQARGKRLVVTFEESVVDRRVRERRARGDRGGAPGRPVATATSRCGSSASRATGSSTTGRSRTCGACSASTPPASRPGPRGRSRRSVPRPARRVGHR